MNIKTAFSKQWLMKNDDKTLGLIFSIKNSQKILKSFINYQDHNFNIEIDFIKIQDSWSNIIDILLGKYHVDRLLECYILGGDLRDVSNDDYRSD